MTDDNKQHNAKDDDGSSSKSARKFVYTAFTAAAWIILLHELLERFSFYGMKGILTYYLNDYLGFDDDTTTIIYHLFVAVSYLTPILGTFLSDNFLGRYKTIVILGIVYLVGHALMPLTALVNNKPGPLVAMFVLAIGTGGIKPCVAAFGGDQIEPGQEEVLDAFFSVFYMCINIGAFASQLLTPILREQVDCIDGTCYPLGFGVPAIAFGLCYVLFLAGTTKYKMYPKPSSPMLNKAFGVIFSGKLKDGAELSDEEVDEGPTEREFVAEVKQALRVCFLFLPFPIYWSLFDQQGSRWVLQGKRMDGYISDGLSLTADQMQSVNPLLIVLIVPIFNNVVYPICAKFGLLTTATSRIFVGYLICAGAFGLTGVMDLIVDSRIPQPLSHGGAEINLFNANNCTTTITYGSHQPQTLERYSSLVMPFTENQVEGNSVNAQFTFTSSCLANSPMSHANFTLTAGTVNRVVIRDASVSQPLEVPFDVAGTRMRFVYTGNQHAITDVRFGELSDSCLPLTNLTTSGKMMANEFCEIALRHSVPLYIDGKKIADISLEGDSVIKYVTVIASDQPDGVMKINKVYERELNPLHIALQLPQYLLMCMSEVLFSVTALAFAYSEAPESLKSLLQTAYLVSIFVGNMIVIGVAAAPKLPRQAYEFFLFAGLVFIAGFVQLWVIKIYNGMKGSGGAKVVPIIEIDMDEKSGGSSSAISSDSANEANDEKVKV